MALLQVVARKRTHPPSTFITIFLAVALVLYVGCVFVMLGFFVYRNYFNDKPLELYGNKRVRA